MADYNNQLNGIQHDLRQIRVDLHKLTTLLAILIIQKDEPQKSAELLIPAAQALVGEL